MKHTHICFYLRASTVVSAFYSVSIVSLITIFYTYYFRWFAWSKLEVPLAIIYSADVCIFLKIVSKLGTYS